jgi:peptide/nickel transport system ATP-binding protein
MGKIVEIGSIDQILSHPKHPYTQALLDAISEPDPANLYRERKIRINDRTDIDAYDGCRFRARCPYAIDKCKEEPNLEMIDDKHYAACFVKLD